MFFDTHCHLNFEAFNGQVDQVFKSAKKAGVFNIVVPGTDLETSKAAVKIAEKKPGIYAAVGIHPHHVFEIFKARQENFLSPLFLNQKLKKIENLLTNKKVIAIGEVGADRHIYQKTVYKNYKVEEEFIKLQKEFLKKQVKLAIEHDKSLILHSREAKKDTLDVLYEIWDKKLSGRSVFHCCEPDKTLLEFAKQQKIFIGVDGDLLYKEEKQMFIKTVPLEILVLETDSPFLSPTKEPFNEPKNIILIAEFIARLKNISTKKIGEITTVNAKKLFKI